MALGRVLLELPHRTGKGVPELPHKSGKGTPRISKYCSTSKVPELPYSTYVNTWVLTELPGTVNDYSQETCPCLDYFSSSREHSTLYPPRFITRTYSGVLLSSFVTSATVRTCTVCGRPDPSNMKVYGISDI